MTEVCLCGGMEPCYGGPCYFVDADAVVAIDAWLDAAESVRPICDNLEEFDALIGGQKKRRAALMGDAPV